MVFGITENEHFQQPGYYDDPGKPIPGQPSQPAARRRRQNPTKPSTTAPTGTMPASGNPFAASPTPIVQLDATDIRILNLLQEDGRLSVRELAKRINLSPTPIHERLKRLESSGIIDHYSAVVNTGKIGQFIVFFVNIVLKEHSTLLTNEFTQSILAFPEVVELHAIGGEQDFMIKVVVPDMPSYRHFFVHRLGEVPNIARLQSVIIIDTLKKDNNIPL